MKSIQNSTHPHTHTEQTKRPMLNYYLNILDQEEKKKKPPKKNILKSKSSFSWWEAFMGLN